MFLGEVVPFATQANAPAFKHVDHGGDNFGLVLGHFTHGFMNGKGIMTFYNGDKYTGEF